MSRLLFFAMWNISFALSFDSIGCSTFSAHIYILTPKEAERLKVLLEETQADYEKHLEERQKEKEQEVDVCKLGRI